jgi:hypothetical protein
MEPKKVALNCKIILELDPFSTVNDQLATADKTVTANAAPAQATSTRSVCGKTVTANAAPAQATSTRSVCGKTVTEVNAPKIGRCKCLIR